MPPALFSVRLPLHINLFQWCSIVAMVAHKAVFDAGEVEHMKAPPKNKFFKFFKKNNYYN